MARREPPLTVKEAAEALNQSQKAVRAMCLAGDLRGAYKLTESEKGHWRIPVKAIDTYQMLRARSAA